jgi:hypothetical protein
MPDRKPTKADVRKWLTALAARCKATMSVDELTRQIDLAIPMLQAKLPAAAFCVSAMDALVASHKFPTFPTEAEILAALEAWWHDNDPNAAHRIADWIEQSPLDAKGKVWVNAWDKKRDMAGLDFLRRNHSQAYAWLIQCDTDASSIAWSRGWMRHTPDAIAQSWDDPTATQHLVAHILAPMPDGSIWTGAAGALSFVRHALARHAPHNLHLVPGGIALQGEIVPVETGLFGG